MAVVAVVLTGCHVDVVGPSLVRVGSDRGVAVALQCRHDTEPCTGTAVVRVDGLDSDAVPFTVAPGGTDAVVVTLTEQQYDLVPSDLYVPAEVRLDSSGPAPARLQTAVRGLRRAGPTTRLLSIAADGSDPNHLSTAGAISDDGRYVAFSSKASNLVPEDTNIFDDIYVHDAVTGEISLVSVAFDGTGATSAEPGGPAMSADGRHVAFLARSQRLVPGGTNAAAHVYVRDLVTGVTTRVSVATDGTLAGSWSYQPVISADGRYVAFRSLAENLVPGDTNGTSDVFVHDRLTGTTTRVSVSSSGAEANAEAAGSWGAVPDLSADGRYVAFGSFASNLVPDDTNGTYDVFVHDRLTGTTTRVSVGNGGSEASGISSGPAVSADGRFVTFTSSASNLAPDDTNGLNDVFLHDRVTGETTAISTDPDGTTANRLSGSSDISADGRYVAFDSPASNLVPGDTNGTTDVFIHDRLTGTTTRASVAVDGAESNGRTTRAVIGDGRHVAFTSEASNLVPGLTTPWTRTYVRDLD